MAIGFPTKANWAAGDVLTASAQDDLAGTLNLLSNASAASGSQLISNAAGTSFAYQATPSASNPIINSAFQVWQRGTSVANPGNYTTYTADRWCGFRNNSAAGLTVSRQVTNDTTNLPFIQYCARVQRDSGTTNIGTLNLTNSFEIINSVPFAGKTITLSYYARAGANFSPSPATLTATVYTGTGSTEVNRATTGYTGDASALNAVATLTNTWQRFTVTGTLASNITQMAVYFASGACVGTAGANDYYEITGVQIDIGSVALPFRTNQPTIATELAACQRYYYRNTSTVSNAQIGMGAAATTTNLLVNVALPVQMRVNPTAIDYANMQGASYPGGTLTLSNLYIETNNCGVQQVALTGVTTGMTASANYYIRASTTGGYVGLSAEL